MGAAGASTTADVIVVGAGFAGISAARELVRLGLRPTVLEARDRIGGRTWVAPRMGTEVELGGTWVHPFQPHVWAEIRRLGLGVVTSPHPVEGRFLAGGRLRIEDAETMWARLDEPMARFMADARELFPDPFAPLRHRDSVSALDGLSAADRLEAIDMDGDQRALMEGMLSLDFCAPLAEGALTQTLRWNALAAGDWRLMGEIVETHKIRGGTRALIDAMAAESPLEIRLSSEVEAVDQDGEGVRCHLRSGESVDGRNAIVTVPFGALARISFDPPLSQAKRRAAADGQASRGIKILARLEEQPRDFCALAPPGNPLTWLRTDSASDGTPIVVGFGVERCFDPANRAAVEAAIRAFLPYANVVDCAAHDWVADPLSGETWPMLRPGQLTGLFEDLLQPDGAVWLAGSGYAEGWAGFIDGAIESGMRVARDIASRRLAPS
jgi:monoamine oxidase